MIIIGGNKEEVNLIQRLIEAEYGIKIGLKEKKLTILGKCWNCGKETKRTLPSGVFECKECFDKIDGLISEWLR